MIIEIKVPLMGESVNEATISTLFKKEGEFVNQDEELFEIETDKTNQILYSPSSGIIHYKVKVGQKVSIDEVIAEINQMQKAHEIQENNTPNISAINSEDKQSQLAKKDENKFLLDDEKNKKINQLSSNEVPLSKNSKETRQKLSNIRKIIAQRVVIAQQTAALLTTFNEIDLNYVQNVREKHKDKFLEVHKVRLGLMSFFVKAVIEALKAYPIFNSYIDQDDIVTRHTYDIGVAVGTEKGVIVPVLKDADKLSFALIERKIAEFAELAKASKIKVEDLQGAGFTITNGGIYGSMLSTPILMPPQSGILGLHKIEKRPVVIDDQIVIRPMMYLALTYDHRIVDGKDAISFLVKIKSELEDLSRLLLDL
jgi:2-oxoglutarate dehydrogenase E2 component (dihydrolipoamide succinyltransferase)